MTLRNLLTMSSGLEWHEIDTPYTSDKNSEIRMDSAPDPYRFALEQSVVAPPGQIWNYNSGSTELLGAILRKATGKPLDQLARSLLFEPLGITDIEWYKYAHGNPSAAAGLRLRPRDLAKIGQLVLQHGAWNGKQLVPAAWIDASTTPQINGLLIFFYGYQFWLGRSLINKHEVDWAAAWGLGGQRLFIVPALDLVVVVNAGLYRSDMQAAVPLKILNQYVLQAAGTP
ncbi:MAG: serine hydrolase [Candidatus Binataceae bacterium]